MSVPYLFCTAPRGRVPGKSDWASIPRTILRLFMRRAMDHNSTFHPAADTILAVLPPPYSTKTIMARRKRKPTTNQADLANSPAGKATEPRSKIKTLTPETLLPKLPSLSRIISVVMLIVGTLAVGALFYRVMAVFFVPLFLAAALVVIFRPVHNWLYLRLGSRPRIAAVSTSGLILVIVLLPVFLVVSIAASQFTALVSQMDFNDLTAAIERGREQLGLSLPHPEKFRRLDDLADQLDEVSKPDVILERIDEAQRLVNYLQEHVEGPATAEAAAAIANQRLNEFSEAVRESKHAAANHVEYSRQVAAEERFQRQSVIAAASIRSWMHSLLGGSFRSQARLLANPSEADFARLLQTSREALQPRFVKLTNATGIILVKIGIGLAILVISIYFFLIDGPSMIRTIMRLSPLDDDYERRLLAEFDRTSRAVVLASILSALVQGMLAAIAFYFCGLKSVVLLFMMTSLMALIPFLGAASVWIPCALYLGAVDERWIPAGILAVYGALVVSSIDNVIKAYVLHGHSQLHPLFALLSVLGGVHVFGPIGILVGPMVVVFLQTLLEILNHELGTDQVNVDISNVDPTVPAEVTTSAG